MAKKESSPPESGVMQAASGAPAAASVELFGNVFLVEGYALPNFQGCHALVKLRDTPNKNVAVLTSQHSLQTILETALATGNLIAFRGSKAFNPPTPLGGTWAVDVYLIDSIILYK
ncbi:MAG TPA: hypothetical protein VF735_00125 [Pyrinomonadaceae bacterium]|jgi:hypothetical protein